MSKPRPHERRHVASAQEIRAGVDASEAQLPDAPVTPRSWVNRYPETNLPIAGESPDFARRRVCNEDDQEGVSTFSQVAANEGSTLPSQVMAQVGELRERYELFCDLREDFLIGYRHNTARAYWGDLDDLWWWANERNKDVFKLTDKDISQYVALHRRRGYSANTIRRKQSTIRRFLAITAT